MKNPTLLSCLALFSMATSLANFASTMADPLVVGFYQNTCSSVESIVRQTVGEFVSQDPDLAAGLIRMHFHDCFVRGCDASVLLDSTPTTKAEKDSPVNNPSLQGFKVIDAAKAAVNAACPSTVSCSDILAFAARDAAYFTGNIDYAVPAGRRDGRVSNEPEVLENLPFPTFNAEKLVANFAKKGLSLDEMVTLSGAHSIGRAHCSSFASNRLYNFSTDQLTDPTIEPSFAYRLKAKCPPSTATIGDPTTVSMDITTPHKLDNEYYKDLLKRRGVLGSDQALWASPLTMGLVLDIVQNGPDYWATNFASAMVKMGNIEVLTGSQGEIRDNCRAVNHY